MNQIGLQLLFTTITALLLMNHGLRVDGKPALGEENFSNSTTHRTTPHETKILKQKAIQAQAITLPAANNVTSAPQMGPNSLVADPCNSFTYGLSETIFTSPLFPNTYPRKIECIKQITAEPGYIVQIQFQDVFEMEDRDEGVCKFDYLEVRDGEFGYSTLKGRYCGFTAPFPYLSSTGRYMWLRFHSDETIEYAGFRAVITYVPAQTTKRQIGDCSNVYTEVEGYINTTTIEEEIWQKALDYSEAVDCTWVVQADKGKKVFLQFASRELALERPNQCGDNYIQIYTSREEFLGIVGEPDKMCGSIIKNTVKSKDNILAIRFFSGVHTTKKEKRSKLFANFTIQRDSTASEPCTDDEFDCKDNSCIPKKLYCNQLVNCERPIDEEKCAGTEATVTADILVIAIIGCLLIAGMCGGLVLNIYRKLRQDKLDLIELRESIQKSRESMSEKQSGKTSLDHLKALPSSSAPVSSLETESGESRDTVIEKSPDLQLVPFQSQSSMSKPPLRPNGDVRKLRVNANVEVLPPDNPITYSPPPGYPHQIALPGHSHGQSQPKPMRRPRNLSLGDLDFPAPTPAVVQFKNPETDVETPVASAPSSELCIEVRDCACQTKESLLASRRGPMAAAAVARKAPLARGEAIEFYDLSTSTPVRRVARMLPRSSGADVLAIYPFYAASSASSETGRSLERLDEYQE